MPQSMIPFEEALAMVLKSATPFPAEPCPLGSALGRILAADICSGTDMPPFNKSAVDGFACRRADISIETRHAPSLRVVETIPAGIQPQRVINPGECARIMTGAMVPEGADVVIMVEETAEQPDGTILLLKGKTNPNICYRAEDLQKGEQILPAGTRITPPVMAVLASVGEISPHVARQPRIAVISTGNELVKPGETPGPAAIRDSNSCQLIAQVARMHLPALDLGIAADTPEAIAGKIRQGFAFSDVVVVSGGVSMGEYDYVPGIMEELGVEILFHSLAVQPGRPTLFGRKGAAGYVFGLPGNPVSSFVLFELLVKPFLYKLMGHTFLPPGFTAPMGTGYLRRRSARKSILPVTLRNGEIFPVDYHGSAHIHSYVRAEGVISIEPGVTELKKGEHLHVRLL